MLMSYLAPHIDPQKYWVFSFWSYLSFAGFGPACFPDYLAVYRYEVELFPLIANSSWL